MSQPRPILIALLLVVLTACSSLAPAAQAPTPTSVPTSVPTPSGRGAGDTLRIILWQAPATLNPHLSTAVKDWTAARITYEPLASFDSDGITMIPFLAAEIPSLENQGVARDGTSVTWKLRQGVKWSDGEPFTADDVQFTFEYITNPAVGATSRNAYQSVKSVEVIDATTVRVNFTTPTPAWTLPFVGAQGMILPKHVFAAFNNAKAKEAPANLIAVGTGPYRATEFANEDLLIIGDTVVNTVRVVFEPNPFFRETDKPYFSRVELQGGADASVAARAVLQNDVVDYAWNIQVDQATLDKLLAEKLGQVIPNLGPQVERLILNNTNPLSATADGEYANLAHPHPFFSDLRVRQAMAYAIDREAILKLYPGSKIAPRLLVAPSIYSATDLPFTYDLTEAARLLDVAGWKDTNGDGVREKKGVRLEVQINTTVNIVRRQTLDIIRAAYESIGIGVKLKFVDVGVFTSTDPTVLDSWSHFYSDMQLFFHGNLSPDPGEYMSWWTQDQIPQQANGWKGFNFERWQNATYNRLYKESTQEMDFEKRRQIFVQMNDLLMKSIVQIPLVNRAQLSAVSNRLTGVALTPWDTDTWNIKDWSRATQ